MYLPVSPCSGSLTAILQHEESDVFDILVINFLDAKLFNNMGHASNCRTASQNLTIKEVWVVDTFSQLHQDIHESCFSAVMRVLKSLCRSKTFTRI